MSLYGGPARAVTRVTLRLVPLTPVHIGDGTDMRLDEYLIDEPRRRGQRFDEYGQEIEDAATAAPPALCRFDQAAAVRAMAPVDRNAFRAALDAGRLADAATVLRKGGEHCIVERIPMSDASARELRHAIGDPQSRSGQVRPFIRSAGRPYIPGSSIKGAFRTALASAALPRGSRPDAGWGHETALREAFGLDPNDTSTDPLRFLQVSDAALPEAATLIDRAEVVDRKNPSAGRMQMHFERTRALTDTDSAAVPAFSVAMTLDARAADERCVQRPAARFDASNLFIRCRNFHYGVFRKELDRFFPEQTQRMFRILRAHSAADGRLPVADNKLVPDFFMLRLGRFGHFESKSLEDVRRGQFPQARNPEDRIRRPNEWGLTRTVTRVRPGAGARDAPVRRDAEAIPTPFGWVIGWVVKEEHV